MFEIYLSSRGPKILEGEQKVTVLRTIRSGKNTFSQILDCVDISKSSLHSVLKKLTADGFLEAYVPEGSNVTEYRIIVEKLLYSVDPKTSGSAGTHPFFTDQYSSDFMERWQVVDILRRGRQGGIAFGPIYSSMMYSLGCMMAEPLVGSPLDVTPVSEFLRRCEMAELTVDDSAPLSYHLRIFESSSPDIIWTFSRMVVSLLRGYLTTLLGHGVKSRTKQFSTWESQELDVVFTEDIDQFNKSQVEYTMEAETTCDFILYYDGERYIPVTDTNYLTILQTLYRHSASSLSLSQDMGLPQSTVSGYLKDMEKQHLIVPIKNKKTVEYRLFALEAFRWKGFDDRLRDESRDNLRKALEDPEHAFRYLLHYLFCNGAMLGFDVELWIHFLGRMMGSSIVTECSDLSLEGIMDLLISKSHAALSAKFAVTGYSFLSVSKLSDFEMSDYIANSYHVLYNSAFCAILDKLMDHPFRVKESTVHGDGNRGYRATFVPEATMR